MLNIDSMAITFTFKVGLVEICISHGLAKIRKKFKVFVFHSKALLSQTPNHLKKLFWSVQLIADNLQYD
jgi:hypothetical protein